MKMFKKGQVTLFIFFGILLILGLLLVFVFSEKPEQVVEDIDTNAIRDYITLCQQRLVPRAIKVTSYQAGYLNPDNYLELGIMEIPYAYDKGEIKLISIPEFENEIAIFVDTYLPDCVNDFSTFSEMGMQFTSNYPETNIEITDTEIIATTSYNLTITKGKASAKIDTIQAHVPSKLKHTYGIVSEFIDKTVENPEWINTEFLFNTGLNISIAKHDSSSLVFTFKDSDYLLDNSPYTFIFANRYQ